jgi:hypothetical protein
MSTGWGTENGLFEDVSWPFTLSFVFGAAGFSNVLATINTRSFDGFVEDYVTESQEVSNLRPF